CSIRSALIAAKRYRLPRSIRGFRRGSVPPANQASAWRFKTPGRKRRTLAAASGGWHVSGKEVWVGTKQQIEQLVEDIKKFLPGNKGPAPKNILAMARALLAKAKKEKDADKEVLD